MSRAVKHFEIMHPVHQDRPLNKFLAGHWLRSRKPSRARPDLPSEFLIRAIMLESVLQVVGLPVAADSLSSTVWGHENREPQVQSDVTVLAISCDLPPNI